MPSKCEVNDKIEEIIDTIPRWVGDVKKAMERLPRAEEEQKRLWTLDLDACLSIPTFKIALLGGTGAGKSSLINSILGADLLATSGNRACTPVIKRISYHDSQTILAEIEFMSMKDWLKELRVLLEDVKEGLPLVRRKLQGKPAETAWHKIQAVYKDLTLSTIGDVTADQLIATEEIIPYFDQRQEITHKAPGQFSEALRQATDHRSHWPLIKQAIIHYKSDVLRTGTTLVDLPGVADSNSARARIAQEYLKECHHIWFVSPITRAVDEQITTDIIGISRAQMRCDGMFSPSKMTYVVTKCEAVRIEEVVQSLQLESDPVCISFRDSLARLSEATQTARDKLEMARMHAKSCTSKLVAVAAGVGGEPDLRTTLVQEGFKWGASHDQAGPPLKKIRFSTEISDAQWEVDEATLALNRCFMEQLNAQKRFMAWCSLQRSMETKELLQAKMAEEFGDDTDGTTIPVFTVSSWDHNHTNGNTGNTVCFSNDEDTEIPALMAHCRGLPYSIRRKYVQRKFQVLESTVASMCRTLRVVEVEDAKNRQHLKELWGATSRESLLCQSLKKDLSTWSTHVTRELKAMLCTEFKKGCYEAAFEASQAAVPMIEEQQATTAWQTLRATYRRHGGFHVNLNNELPHLFMESLSTTWCEVFGGDLFADISLHIQNVIEDKLQEVASSALSDHGNQAAKIQAAICFEEAEDILTNAVDVVTETIQTEQRVVTRSIAPYIQQSMLPGYEAAIKHTGRGSVARQNATIIEHVVSIKDELPTRILKHLGDIAEAAGKALKQALDDLALRMYVGMSVLWQTQGNSDESLEDILKELSLVSEKLKSQRACI